MKWTFDARADDVYWCTADVGWVTGHTYITYGPLAAGVTQVVFEGVPTFPNAGRFWDMIARHKVSVFYTAPTAIRSLIKAAEANQDVHPRQYDLDSLRIIGSVGDPSTRGLDLVPQERRPRALPDRRHLVADRNRRAHAHAAAGSHAAQSRVRARCRCRALSRPSSTRPAAMSNRARAASWSSSVPGRP